jgi:putative addiction module component (TIGR02574 family)
MGTKDLHNLRQQAMALDETDREDLAYDLLDTLDPGPTSEIERAWLEEAGRRIADLDAGRTRTIPVDEVLENIEKRLL